MTSLVFQYWSTLKENNLLLQEQILSFKSRPHVKELPDPEKQTGIYASYYNIIFGKETGGVYQSRRIG